MWTNALPCLENGTITIDPNLSRTGDDRFGLTVIARPSEEVKESLQRLITELESIAPDQYYYPLADLHITVLPIISCLEGFRLTEVDPAEYVQHLREGLAGSPPFSIACRGITASPEGLLMQGFPLCDTLESIRESIRRIFRNSRLRCTLDSRYKIQTAHATIMRFKHPLQDPARFARVAATFRAVELGTVTVSNLALVYSDWYQRKENTTLVERFELYAD